MAPESTGQQDLRTYLRVFWRWKFLFLAFVILVPLGVYLVERNQQKVYESSTLMQLQDVSASSLGSSGGPVVSGNLAAVARLVTTTPVGNIAARLLHEPPGSLTGEASARADPDTGFLTITARGHSPARAAAVANAFAAALAQRQSNQARAVIGRQITSLQKQLAATSRANPAARITLGQQIAQLQALRGSTGSGATVIQAATPSATPVSPHLRRAVELGLVIGLLLGIGAVLLAENADRMLRSPEDVENLTGWPLLAAISPGAFDPANLDDPRNEEAFQMLDGALTYFNVERPLASVAIVSAQVGTGKTTVAVGLATAVARAGKRAVLIDADLRRPQACARLGISADEGLGAVLAGRRRLDDVLVEYPIDSPDGGQLLVLGAGRPSPPNPAALLGSQEMRDVVRQLESRADLVIVDTVASLAVSDSLPLLQVVSGNVVVVRMSHTSRAAVRRLQKMITSAHGPVLGAVATASGAAADGYAAYHYTENGHRGGALGLLHLRRRSRMSVDAPSSNGSAGAHADAPAREPTMHAGAETNPDQPDA